MSRDFFQKTKCYKLHVICYTMLFFYIFISALPVFAAPPDEKPQPVGTQYTETFLEKAGFTVFESEGQDVRLFIVALIKMALSFTGFLFFVLIFWGGYLWMTARGSEEQITKAKQRISKAVVGFIVVLTAYSVVYFIGEAVRKAIAPSEGAVPGPKRDIILPD